MSNDMLVWMFIGAIVGWAISQLLLVFFMDEIFSFLDRLRESVRKACGLDE